jgi:hypothetical protein
MVWFARQPTTTTMKEAPVSPADSATSPVAFATSPLPLSATFDGGRLTSDGGMPWLGEADAALGLCEALAACIPEWRRGPVRHSLSTLVRQRVFQIALGYEDQDDADTLRRDPLLKLLCGRLPETDADDLASQPTFSRLENAVDRHACYRLAEALVEVYLYERERDGVPDRLVLDLDGTDDPTHGDQEGTAYHGYYHQHMYHPLLVFDADTGQLVAAILRPGTVHDSRGVLTLLKRLVPKLRERWPGVAIELRADSGFATPKLYSYCEEEGIDYTIGLASNARLSLTSPPRSWPKRKANTTRPPGSSSTRKMETVPRCGWWARGATGPRAGIVSAAWCSRRRCCPKGRMYASWSPAAPRRSRWRSTSGTSSAARRRVG